MKRSMCELFSTLFVLLVGIDLGVVISHVTSPHALAWFMACNACLTLAAAVAWLFVLVHGLRPKHAA